MLSTPSKELIKDSKSLCKYIYMWFCEDKGQDIETIGNFLAKINVYNESAGNRYIRHSTSKKVGSKMPLFERYEGVEGLRSAVRKLFEYTLEQEGTRTLYIYSDQ